MPKPSEIILERATEHHRNLKIDYESLSAVDKAILDFLDSQDNNQ